MSTNRKYSCFYWLNRSLEIASSAGMYIGMGLIMIMVLLVVVHVIGRYLFDYPVPGQIELTCFMMVMSVFLMAGYTQLQKGHIAVDMFFEKYSKKTQVRIDIIVYILCLALAVLICWQSFVRGNTIMEAGQKSTILGIPQFPVIYVMAIGWGLFSFSILVDLINSIFKAVKE